MKGYRRMPAFVLAATLGTIYPDSASSAQSAQSAQSSQSARFHIHIIAGAAFLEAQDWAPTHRLPGAGISIDAITIPWWRLHMALDLLSASVKGQGTLSGGQAAEFGLNMTEVSLGPRLHQRLWGALAGYAGTGLGYVWLNSEIRNLRVDRSETHTHHGLGAFAAVGLRFHLGPLTFLGLEGRVGSYALDGGPFFSSLHAKPFRIGMLGGMAW